MVTYIAGGRGFSEKPAGFISAVYERTKKKERKKGKKKRQRLWFKTLVLCLFATKLVCKYVLLPRQGSLLSPSLVLALLLQQSLETGARTQRISRKSSFQFSFFLKSCSLLIVTRASILPCFCSARN